MYDMYRIPYRYVNWRLVGRGCQCPAPGLASWYVARPALRRRFIPRVTRLHEVPIGTMNVRDVVAKALSSRQPFFKRCGATHCWGRRMHGVVVIRSCMLNRQHLPAQQCRASVCDA